MSDLTFKMEDSLSDPTKITIYKVNQTVMVEFNHSVKFLTAAFRKRRLKMLILRLQKIYDTL